MNSFTRRLVALAGAIAVSFGSASCAEFEMLTSDSQPTTKTTAVGEILKKAKATALAAKSGAFSGYVVEDGERMTVDFKGTADGKQADLTVKTAELGGKVRVIVVPSGIYMQGDKALWTKANGRAAAKKFAGKWVKAPMSMESLTKQLTIKSILEKSFAALTVARMSDKVGEETVNGVPCWVLTDAKGKANGALYVSKKKFEIVRFAGSTASPGHLDFSRWNANLGIKAPAKRSIVPLR